MTSKSNNSFAANSNLNNNKGNKAMKRSLSKKFAPKRKPETLEDAFLAAVEVAQLLCKLICDPENIMVDDGDYEITLKADDKAKLTDAIHKVSDLSLDIMHEYMWAGRHHFNTDETKLSYLSNLAEKEFYARGYVHSMNTGTMFKNLNDYRIYRERNMGDEDFNRVDALAKMLHDEILNCEGKRVLEILENQAHSFIIDDSMKFFAYTRNGWKEVVQDASGKWIAA